MARRGYSLAYRLLPYIGQGDNFAPSRLTNSPPSQLYCGGTFGYDACIIAQKPPSVGDFGLQQPDGLLTRFADWNHVERSRP
jgi:hypothetical protein